jgi:hypothetical protein
VLKRILSGGFIVPISRRHIVGMPVFLVGVCWAFGMVCGVFDAFSGGSLKSLISVRQILDRVFRGFRFSRQT